MVWLLAVAAGCGLDGARQDDDREGTSIMGAQPETGAIDQTITGCSSDCLGGACVDGVCQPIELAGHQNRAGVLAVTATDVFWSVTVGYTINKATLVPGPLNSFQVGDPFVSSPFGVAVASGYVLWANNTGNNSIVRAAPGSSDPTPVILASGQSAPISIATDGVFAYWTNYGAGTIARIHIRAAVGEVPTILAQNQANPWGLALRNGFLYWTNSGGGGAVRRLSLANPAVVTNLATGGLPLSLAVDDTSVYWVDTSSVRKVAVAGGSAVSLATGQSNPEGIAIDDQHVFWSNYDGGTVMRADLDGAHPTIMATAQRHPFTMAQDALAIYWVNDDAPDGGIEKLAK